MQSEKPLRIVAFGDIHGATINLMKLAHEFEEADRIVFVGDGASSLNILDDDARKKLIAVRGNCDLFCRMALSTIAFQDGIFVAHGHEHGVKDKAGINALAEAARAFDAKVCFFGHNHKASVTTIDGLTLINPGTLGDMRTNVAGEYAIVTIENGKVKRAEFKTV